MKPIPDECNKHKINLSSSFPLVCFSFQFLFQDFHVRLALLHEKSNHQNIVVGTYTRILVYHQFFFGRRLSFSRRALPHFHQNASLPILFCRCYADRASSTAVGIESMHDLWSVTKMLYHLN